MLAGDLGREQRKKSVRLLLPARLEIGVADEA